jgi:AcrR family transcriptional regulator
MGKKNRVHANTGRSLAAGLHVGGNGAPARRKRTRPASAPTRRARRPKVAPQQRRQAIFAAALSIFAERGFAAARLDDIALRAGIAKGTLYLYFRGKEHLFEELIRSAVVPVLDRLDAIVSSPAAPADKVLETLFALFENEILRTERKLILRLVIAEGPRFPAIAAFYHRQILTRGLRLLRTFAARAAANGEFASDAAARFPQLIVAPLILAVVWDAVFARIEPLDVRALLAAHRQLLTGRREPQ